MNNNLGKNAYTGIIGGIVTVVAWFIVNKVSGTLDPYVAAGLAGFCGSFFASMFAAQKERVQA
ncbi:MAG: hypothetical protein COB10_02925 [Planctomycetota bacterium]|nr:MAG: hypothetical protein COB10_02925 [Planctomycetota bacterium]HIC23037.1 hypothetical protein [Planctomycetota bacterium]